MSSLLVLKQWLKAQLKQEALILTRLPADASFRVYYRIKNAQQVSLAPPCLGVLSPPQTENNGGFIRVSQALQARGLSVPVVMAHDLERGFLMLTDLGDQTLHRRMQVHIDDADFSEIALYYQKSLVSLGQLQKTTLSLPCFDNVFMQQELKNFKHWFLNKHCGLKKFSQGQEKVLKKIFKSLITDALSQPQVFIHRDYHSKNIMILQGGNIGLLDFQDAMLGPVTYDLVSLLRDCYVRLPEAWVNTQALAFYQHYLSDMIPSESLFWRYFDAMGLQRHLKALFIFARKYYRDGVPNYLAYIPNTLGYIKTIAQKYEDYKDLYYFIEDVNISA